MAGSPTPDRGPDADGGLIETQSQTQVRDVEQISERHRLKELLNRRREVLDTRDRVVEALEYGQIGYQRAVSIYAEKLTGMVLDMYPMFHWAERGDFFFQDVVLDTVTVPPPSDIRTSVAETAGRPEPKTVEIRGLSWFLDNDVVVSRSFTGFGSGGVQKVQRVEQTTISMRSVTHDELIEEFEGAGDE